MPVHAGVPRPSAAISDQAWYAVPQWRSALRATGPTCFCLKDPLTHMSDDILRLPHDPATAEVFHELAGLVYARDDFSQVYEAVVSVAPRLIDGCDHASLMLQRNGEFYTAAASDDVAAGIDRFEREIGEGPCIDALREEAVYCDEDLTDGSPWPSLTARILTQTPVRSAAGFRLMVASQRNGALNIFSDTPGALGPRSVDQGILLASFISVALIAAHERKDADTLRQGLKSNREIGKAVGLMMAFHKITDEAAFNMLKSASQDMNLKLVEVARQVVEHHNKA